MYANRYVIRRQSGSVSESCGMEDAARDALEVVPQPHSKEESGILGGETLGSPGHLNLWMGSLFSVADFHQTGGTLVLMDCDMALKLMVSDIFYRSRHLLRTTRARWTR